eukprot:106805-Prymnesium_polylepis.2
MVYQPPPPPPPPPSPPPKGGGGMNGGAIAGAICGPMFGLIGLGGYLHHKKKQGLADQGQQRDEDAITIQMTAEQENV